MKKVIGRTISQDTRDRYIGWADRRRQFRFQNMHSFISEKLETKLNSILSLERPAAEFREVYVCVRPCDSSSKNSKPLSHTGIEARIKRKNLTPFKVVLSFHPSTALCTYRRTRFHFNDFANKLAPKTTKNAYVRLGSKKNHKVTSQKTAQSSWHFSRCSFLVSFQTWPALI